MPWVTERLRAVTRNRFSQRLCALAWLGGSVLAAQTLQPGQTSFGSRQYTEYRAGELPIIITAPHGGALTPTSIPDRALIAGQDVVTTNDANTVDLARRIADTIVERTGRHPHLVICNLARIKLDANRELAVAAQGNADAAAAWNDYHGFIRTAQNAAQLAHGFSFLVDQHGHGHAIPRLELGYNLGSNTLALSDTELARPAYQWNSYFRTLPLFRPDEALPAQLRGPRSLGEFFSARNFPATPSPRDPAPGDPAFFNGGYTTDAHTCITDNGPGYGVQIEANLPGVRDTAANRQTFAIAVAEAVGQFLFDHYGFVAGTAPVFRLAPPAADLRLGGPPVAVTITRDGYRAAAETIAVSYGGSAVRNTDFTAPVVVAFAANQPSATLLITPAPGLASRQGDATLELSLVPSSLQAAATSPLVLALGDGRSTTVRAEAVNPRVTEASGTAGFRLRRTDTSQPLVVNLAWKGDAIAQRDYVLPSAFAATAAFAAGQNEIAVNVPLVDDAILRPVRQLTLAVTAGTGYVPGGSDATVEIDDDDSVAGLGLWLAGPTRDGGYRDDSGRARHAAAQPAARGPGSITAPGGTGFSFNGSDQTLQLPRFAIDPQDAFTLAFRFRLTPGATVSNQTLAALGTRGAPGTLQVYLSSATTLRTHLVDSSGRATDTELDVSGSWTDGTWRHYALVVDARGGRRVFIDGVPVRAAPGWAGSLSATEQLWLGWRPQSSTTGHLSGALADVRIYQRAIVPAEVSALATGQATFAAWREERGLAASTTPTDDPDGDGWPNALEYALGSDPVARGSIPALTAVRDGAVARLAFNRRAPVADLALAIEANDAGGPWVTVGSLAAGATTWNTATGIRVSDTAGAVSVSDPSGGPSRAWRLRVALDGTPVPFIVPFGGATPPPGIAPGRIANLSIRTGAGTGNATLIVGFFLGGTGTGGGKSLVLRAAGPTLAAYGVNGAISDPDIELLQDGVRVATNDNWGGTPALTAAFNAVGAFAFAAPDSRDAALVPPSLATGGYSLVVRGTGNATGIALAEIYDATPAEVFSDATPRLTNVSARTLVGTGEGILIAGFVIAGETPRRVLVRAIGPTLGTFGVGGVLANPQLMVFRDGAVLATNDDWGGGATLRDAFASVGAFALPAASADAALLLSLAPGAYSAQVAGVGGATGVALVEVYELP